MRAEEVVEEKGSHQAGWTHIHTDRQVASPACPVSPAQPGSGLANSAFLSLWAVWVEHTDRRLDSLRGERGREEEGAMNSGSKLLLFLPETESCLRKRGRASESATVHLPTDTEGFCEFCSRNLMK